MKKMLFAFVFVVLVFANVLGWAIVSKQQSALASKEMLNSALEGLNQARASALESTNKALLATQEALASERHLTESLEENITLLQANIALMEETRGQMLRSVELSDDINLILKEKILKLEKLVRIAREVAEQSEENIRLELRIKAEQGK